MLLLLSMLGIMASARQNHWGFYYYYFFLLVKTEKRQRLKIKPIIFDTTVETWLVLTQQVAKGLDRQKPAVLSVQSKLSAEI